MRKNLYLVLTVVLITLSCSNKPTDNLIISAESSDSIVTTIEIPEGEIFYQLEKAKNYSTKIITKDTISGYYKVYSIVVDISSSYLRLDCIIK